MDLRFPTRDNSPMIRGLIDDSDLQTGSRLATRDLPSNRAKLPPFATASGPEAPGPGAGAQAPGEAGLYDDRQNPPEYRPD
jgi:hypothetical protein